jgi:hypothetical protein
MEQKAKIQTEMDPIERFQEVRRNGDQPNPEGMVLAIWQKLIRLFLINQSGVIRGPYAEEDVNKLKSQGSLD